MKTYPISCYFCRSLFCIVIVLIGTTITSSCGDAEREPEAYETTVTVSSNYPYQMVPISSGLTIEGSLYASSSMLDSEKISGPIKASSANSSNTSFEFVFSNVGEGTYFLNILFKGDANVLSASSSPSSEHLTGNSVKQLLKTTAQEQCEQDLWAAAGQEQNCANFEEQCREAIRVECEEEYPQEAANPENTDQTAPTGSEEDDTTSYQASTLPVLASAGVNVLLRNRQKAFVSLISTLFNLSYDNDQDGAINLDEVLNPPSETGGPSIIQGNGQNTLSWTATDLHGTSYNLYWSLSMEAGRSEWTKIEKASNPYVHTGLANGTVYYYTLTAANDGGEGPDSPIVAAEPLGTYWNWEQKISGTGYPLNDIVYYSGMFVIVGERGTVVTSPDGSAWAVNPSVPTTSNLMAVNYCAGKFIAVGGGGIIITSPNGSAWTINQMLEDYTLYDIACSNDLIVAVGNRGTILTSTDGLTWTLQNSGASSDLYSIAYGNGKYVAVASDTSNLYISIDGTNWASAQHGTVGSFSDIIYAKGMFVAVGSSGKIMTSEDGLTWQSRASGTTNNLSALTFGDNSFWAIGENGVVTGSLDGINWRPNFFWGGRNHLNGGIYGNNLFVLVGNYGIILSSTMHVDVNLNILTVP